MNESGSAASRAALDHPYKMLAGCADMLNGVPLNADDFVAVLTDHALVEIRCDHDAKTDAPACNCATVALGSHPTVQAAKEAWAAHVWEVFHAPADRPGAPAASALDRLRVWAQDDIHTLQSVRMHEPVYTKPRDLRADVRALLAERDAVVGELAWYKLPERRSDDA